MLNIRRMWVNQPSTLQAYHQYHGLNVLAHHDSTYNNPDSMIVYFVSGPVASMEFSRLALSNGWLDEEKSRKYYKNYKSPLFN